MYRNRPSTAIDFYKADHRRQYPNGTEYIYSNLTPRSDRLFNWENKSGKVVFFGIQAVIKAFLIDLWNKEFFQQPKSEVIGYYKRRMDTSLGKDSIPCEHLESLHDLGYLPIKIKSLPEGSRVPIGVPMLTITNTLPEYFWLVNYLETILSALLWKPCTSATIAMEYKSLLVEYADKTGVPREFVQFQGHDFSARGLSGFDDIVSSGAGHLLSFNGTDSVPAIDFLEDYYNANAENELIGASVPATEHSVMCAGGKVDELETFKRLITELYPKGIVSIVSDTWDFWKVLTEYTVRLKSEIEAREGTTVFRPDSGDPVCIIAGDESAPIGTPENIGAVGCLWNVFGGTVNDKGFKVLNPKVGLIYGDSITLQRAESILKKLDKNGFASSNIVFGIGSFTYEYVTRDTFGFAMKATHSTINGVDMPIFKDPVTDSGVKKSAIGLLKVDDNLTLLQNVSRNQEQEGLLETVFENGLLINETSLNQIRERLIKK